MTLRSLIVCAVALPSALLLGALGFQYLGGLPPCELCIDQRWPHLAAIVLGLIAFAIFAAGRRAAARFVTSLAAVGILVSGGIAVFHSGVERTWWPGPGCAATADPNASVEDFLSQLSNAAVVNCSDIPWSLLGLSMANYNAIISLAGGVALLIMLLISAKRPA